MAYVILISPTSYGEQIYLSALIVVWKLFLASGAVTMQSISKRVLLRS